MIIVKRINVERVIHEDDLQRYTEQGYRVIKGKKNDEVCRRTLKVNGRYIRGYGIPKYDVVASAAKPQPQPKPTTSNALGTYRVTASSLIVRTGPGKQYSRKPKKDLTANAQ